MTKLTFPNELPKPIESNNEANEQINMGKKKSDVLKEVFVYG